MFEKFWMLTLLAAGLAAGTTGCDKADDEDATSDGGVSAEPAPPAADEGQNVTVAVSAVAGGLVASPSGSGKLTVPAGALAADTELTLAVQPAEAGTAASVYEFGPDGTQFLVPCTLELAFTGEVPSGKKAVLAVEEGGTWTEIPGSALAGGKVTGNIDHFSRFTIIFVNGEAVLESACADVARDFSPCGGDPSGTWQIEEVCTDSTTLAQNPFGEQCPDAVYEIDLTIAGTVELTGERLISSTTQTLDIAFTVPKSCIQGAPCDALANDGADGDNVVTCNDTGAACACEQTEVDESDDPMGDPYVVEGNTVVQTDDDDPSAEVTRLDFCVAGDRMTVRVEPNDEGDPVVVYVLTR
jgi:hypothetical protein